MAVAVLTFVLQISVMGGWVSFGTIGLAWAIMLCVLYLVLLFGFALTVFLVRTDPDEIAQSLKSQDGFIPGIRPGRNTAEHLNSIVWRAAIPAAICLGVLCIGSDFVFIRLFGLPPAMGGTGLVIVTFVILGLMPQLLHDGKPRNPDPPDLFGPDIGKRPSPSDWEESDFDPSELFPERQRRHRAHAHVR